MVTSVTGSLSSSLLRAPAAGIAGLKSNQQATQAIIDQLQQGLDQTNTANRQLAAAPLSSSTAPLPRGSLVDKLV